MTTPVLARGMSVSGLKFQEHYADDRISLELRGAGLFKYKGLIKVNAAALYLPPDLEAEALWADVPKRIEIAYFRNLSAHNFVDSGDVYLRKNLDADSLASIRVGIDQINRLYEDVKKGDRYALTYIPGHGTEVALNGVVQGTIPGADFALHYFTIWLGSDPVSTEMRDAMLGLTD